MKILFDHQIFEIQNFGGISRYFTELLKYFSKTDLIKWELSLKYTNNEYLKNWPYFRTKIKDKPNPYSQFLYSYDFRGKWTLYELWNKLNQKNNLINLNKEIALSSLNNSDFDLFHPTYYHDYFIPYLKNKPFVVTAHDLTYEKFATKYPIKDSFIKAKRNLLTKADKIIAVSENTKKDIINIYGINADKIDIIHLASSLTAELGSPSDFDYLKLPQNFILYVGNRDTYKNFTFFIKSIAPVLQDNAAIQVVCTGKEFNTDELNLFKGLGLSNKIHQRFVNDSELGFLYRNALLFAFPSIYEGFGIPVLEAFSCDCPVVLSNQSSLPEVGGNGALYFDPYEAKSIQEAVEKVLNNDALCQQLKEAGKEQLKKFSWQITSEKTVAVYKNVLKQS